MRFEIKLFSEEYHYKITSDIKVTFREQTDSDKEDVCFWVIPNHETIKKDEPLWFSLTKE